MRAIVLGLALVLAGCGTGEGDEIGACEAYIQGKLRSPSTYKRIEASSYGEPVNQPTKFTVFIEYDAANAYGTPIRERQMCTYPAKGGKPDTVSFIDHDAALDNIAEAAADEAMNAAINAAE